MRWQKVLSYEVNDGFIPTDNGQRSSEDIVSDLTYYNYAYNRDEAPDVSVERWAKIFGADLTARMEYRYQMEKNDIGD